MLNYYFTGAPNIVGIKCAVINNEIYLVEYTDEQGRGVALEQIYQYFAPYTQVSLTLAFIRYSCGLLTPVIMGMDGSGAAWPMYNGLSVTQIEYTEQVNQILWAKSQWFSSAGIAGENNTYEYLTCTQYYRDFYDYISRMGQTVSGASAPAVEAPKPEPKKTRNKKTIKKTEIEDNKAPKQEVVKVQETVEKPNTEITKEPEAKMQEAVITKVSEINVEESIAKKAQLPDDDGISLDTLPVDIFLLQDEAPKETIIPEIKENKEVVVPLSTRDLTPEMKEYQKLIPEDMVARIEVEALRQEYDNALIKINNLTTQLEETVQAWTQTKQELRNTVADKKTAQEALRNLRDVNKVLSQTIEDYEAQGIGEKPSFSEIEYKQLQEEVSRLSGELSELKTRTQLESSLNNTLSSKAIDLGAMAEGQAQEIPTEVVDILECEEEPMVAEPKVDLVKAWLEDNKVSERVLHKLQAIEDNDINNLLEIILELDKEPEAFLDIERLDGDEVKQQLLELTKTLVEFKSDYRILTDKLHDANAEKLALEKELSTVKAWEHEKDAIIVNLNLKLSNAEQCITELSAAMNDMRIVFQEEILQLSKDHSRELTEIIKELARREVTGQKEKESTQAPNIVTEAELDALLGPGKRQDKEENAGESVKVPDFGSPELLSTEFIDDAFVDTEPVVEKKSKEKKITSDIASNYIDQGLILGDTEEMNSLLDNFFEPTKQLGIPAAMSEEKEFEEEEPVDQSTKKQETDEQSAEVVIEKVEAGAGAGEKELDVDKLIAEDPSERIRREMIQVAERINNKFGGYISALDVINNPDKEEYDPIFAKYEGRKSLIDYKNVDLNGVKQALDAASERKEHISELSGIINSEEYKVDTNEEAKQYIQEEEFDEEATEIDLSIFEGMGMDVTESALSGLDNLVEEYTEAPKVKPLDKLMDSDSESFVPLDLNVLDGNLNKILNEEI